MFDERVGEKEIYNFTLGNPKIETPAKFTEEHFKERMNQLLEEKER